MKRAAVTEATLVMLVHVRDSKDKIQLRLACRNTLKVLQAAWPDSVVADHDPVTWLPPWLKPKLDNIMKMK